MHRNRNILTLGVCVYVLEGCMCVCTCINLCVPQKKNGVCIHLCVLLFFKHTSSAFPVTPSQMLTCRVWLQKWEDQRDTSKFRSTRQSQIIAKSEVTPPPLTQRSTQLTTRCCRAAEGASLARQAFLALVLFQLLEHSHLSWHMQWSLLPAWYII